MKQEMVNALKERLVAEKESIEKELTSFAKEDTASEGNWDTKFPKREDADKDEVADDAQEYDNMISVEHSLELKLKEVNVALEKIDQGNYGLCEKCGKEIEAERLDAMPAARLCMDCNNKK